MKLSALLLTGAISLFSVSSATAETVNVYCANPSNGQIYSLVDDAGQQIKISGQRGETHSIQGKTFTKFNVINSDLQTINNSCNTGFFPISINLKSRVIYTFTNSIDPINEHSFIRFSDKNLKQRIQPLQDSLDKISRVGGYSYSWRSDNTGQYEYGVIAQEIQAELPELVKQDDQGYLRVDYRGLIPVLLESIKELKVRIETLEAQF